MTYDQFIERCIEIVWRRTHAVSVELMDSMLRATFTRTADAFPSDHSELIEFNLKLQSDYLIAKARRFAKDNDIADIESDGDDEDDLEGLL
jgi:hypothetical protein